jgi:hypothetical protein
METNYGLRWKPWHKTFGPKGSRGRHLYYGEHNIATVIDYSWHRVHPAYVLIWHGWNTPTTDLSLRCAGYRKSFTGIKALAERLAFGEAPEYITYKWA